MSRKFTLIASDFFAFYGALALVLLIRYGRTDFSAQWSIHLVPFSVLLAVWIFALYITNLYDARIMRNDREFFGRLGQAMGFATVTSLIFFYLIPYFGIAPKRNLFLFLLALAILMWAIRYLYNRVAASGSKKQLLIVGLNREALDLATLVTENPQLGYKVSALVRLGNENVPTEHSYRTQWNIIDDLSIVDRYIAQHNIDTVVISPAAYQMEEVVRLFYGALARHVDFTSLVTISEELTGRVPLGSINQAWFLDNITEGSKKSLDTYKRGMDIGLSILLGIPTLILTPFIALILFLDSPGPIFFRQTRSGRNGTQFQIIKFRTMRTDAETHSGAVWATEHDPRITRVGRLLRTTRIDELPQLWNILRGEMSLVGPRAERPEFDATLAPQIPFYRERYLVKPGLSGWAQINYPYGSSVADALQKLQYDLYYIKHRSLSLDIEIILKTISISLRRAGR
jgi:exopolysaccharide biosynthesis polyprenyl glycosylphosphotransferase